jgi:hypothetical protein
MAFKGSTQMTIIRAAVLLSGLGALLAGCAVLEPSVISSDTLASSSSGSIRVDVLEELTGERRDQFRASNYSSSPLCAQVSFDGEFYAGGGYSMGGVYLVQPNSTVDIGYVDHPSNYTAHSRLWSPGPGGGCGA